jgi:hypothetical protein
MIESPSRRLLPVAAIFVAHLLAGPTSGFEPPVGLYALGAAQDNPNTPADERLAGIRDYEFVSGFTLRLLWKDVETSPGVYDFAVVDEALSRVEAIGQRLNLEMLDAPPSYVVDGAAATYIDHRGGERPVPWDPFLQQRYAAVQTAFAEHVVDDGRGLPLNQHPVLASVDGSPGGLNFGVRDLNNGLRSHPEYTADRYMDAVIDGTVATRAAFPDHQGFLAFFGFDDGVAEPPVDEQLIARLSEEFNGPGQPTLALFVENLSDNGPAPGGGAGEHLAEWVSLGGSTMMQALDSWQAHRPDRDPQLASLNPAAGIELAYESFGTRFFELYVTDFDNAMQGAIDAEGGPLLDDLRYWSALLTGPTTPGDFNDDGRVDAADYTVWRDTLAATSDLAAEDYAIWAANYGRTAEPASLIPEPAAISMLVISYSLMLTSGRCFDFPGELLERRLFWRCSVWPLRSTEGTKKVV